MEKTILVTGAAGFIGYHLCEALLKQGHNVVGLDNINDYYDINLKFARLNQLGILEKDAEILNVFCSSIIHDSKMQFVRMNLEDKTELPILFEQFNFDMVCNLAAQAGVRYSIENPVAYIESNIHGFLNILECCRHHNVSKIVYASSSSVYGNSDDVPFTENANVDHPISLYAATKKSNELMAHTYSHLYGIETIGLRFFTVYGPWGRPDMAMYLFTDAILNNKPIKVFNRGELSRDFTYISDIISGVLSTLLENSKENNLYKLYNIGNGKPVKLLKFIEILENKIGVKADKVMLPMQPGDVNETFASTRKLQADFSYKSNFDLEDGISNFVDWYLLYNKIVVN